MKLTLNPNRFFPHIASLTAAGILGIVVFDSISSMKDFDSKRETTDPAFVQTSKPTASSSVKRQTINPVHLANLHVFGKISDKQVAKKQTKSEPLTPEALPESTIKLDIKGLFSNDDAKQGLAVISNNGKHKSFRVGDEIDKNITLRAVYKGYVVIANNDKLERLELPEYRAANGNQHNARDLAFKKRVAMSEREQDEFEEALQ